VRPVKGLEWTTATRQIALKSAMYNPITHSVTLTPAEKVRKFPFFMILNTAFANAINLVGQPTPASAAQLLPKLSPITDTTGNPLDSKASGTPDGILEAIVVNGKAPNRLFKQGNPHSNR
jgi:hypothetical protein